MPAQSTAALVVVVQMISLGFSWLLHLTSYVPVKLLFPLPILATSPIIFQLLLNPKSLQQIVSMITSLNLIVAILKSVRQPLCQQILLAIDTT